jgi:molybdopterin converting factor small subunit
MSVKIHIHKTHRQYTGGLSVIETQGDTVGMCLSNLIEQFPDIKSEIYDNNGKLTNKVEIYLNMKSAYPDELAKPVKNGDEIHLTLLLAGG